MEKYIAAIGLEVVASCENSREMRLENAARSGLKDLKGTLSELS
jgi:hypothetical protein